MDQQLVKTLAEMLNNAVAAAHSKDALTPDDFKALGELHSNLVAVLPKEWWLENYTKR